MVVGIVYIDSLEEITPDRLTRGFWVGWSDPPPPSTHLRILRGSYRVWLAVDDETGQIVGFVNALSDGILTAFIPLLEVLPAHQGQGIGSELMGRMLESLRHLYSIDLLCDDDLLPFYGRFSMIRANGMMIRNYSRQSGT